MTKTDFTQEIANKGGFSKKEGARIVNLVLDTIAENLAKGECVTFPGFGIFKTVEKEESVSHGFGKKTVVPAHKAIKFSAGSTLKKTVNS